MREALARLADLPEGEGRECVVGEADAQERIVLVRLGDRVLAYENRCPHFLIPLHYEPNQFWIYGGDTLMCAHHAALFDLESGVCFDGPCKGAALRAIAVRLEGDAIYRENDASPGT
ncbi:MAG: Rieske 2Fe-2S domain-containing protein [Burkholderiaceae bacterium]|jgi:nitrite reductase/ring-hydroxylating ferredoxin subunit